MEVCGYNFPCNICEQKQERQKIFQKNFLCLRGRHEVSLLASGCVLCRFFFNLCVALTQKISVSWNFSVHSSLWNEWVLGKTTISHSRLHFIITCMSNPVFIMAILNLLQWKLMAPFLSWALAVFGNPIRFAQPALFLTLHSNFLNLFHFLHFAYLVLLSSDNHALHYSKTKSHGKETTSALGCMFCIVVNSGFKI